MSTRAHYYDVVLCETEIGYGIRDLSQVTVDLK
jgi:hypothetical protein